MCIGKGTRDGRCSASFSRIAYILPSSTAQVLNVVKACVLGVCLLLKYTGYNDVILLICGVWSNSCNRGHFVRYMGCAQL